MIFAVKNDNVEANLMLISTFKNKRKWIRITNLKKHKLVEICFFIYFIIILTWLFGVFVEFNSNMKKIISNNQTSMINNIPNKIKQYKCNKIEDLIKKKRWWLVDFQWYANFFAILWSEQKFFQNIIVSPQILSNIQILLNSINMTFSNEQ